LQERSEAVYALAQKAFRSFKENSHAVNGPGQNLGAALLKDLRDPHVINPHLSAELVTCIVYQETATYLDPHDFNYSYCQNTPVMSSTAHGLGQITRGTFDFLHSVGHLPFTTVDVDRGISRRNLFELMSGSVEMQIEAAMRILNFKIKDKVELKYKSKNKLLSAREAIMAGVYSYDQDNSSEYLNNVVNKCLPCMQTLKASDTPYKCFGMGVK